MQHINSFSGGMKSGIDYTIVPQNTYLYMLNGCIVSRDKRGFVITSIKGNTELATFGNDEVPIGSTEFNGIVYIITHKNVAPAAQYICVYSYYGTDGIVGWTSTLQIVPNGPDINGLMIPQALLGYSRTKLLQVFAKGSYDGSVDLYICDGLNPNTVINTGLDKDGKKTTRQYIAFTSAIQFALQKSVSVVPTVSSSILNTGNLKPGTYYFYIRYEDESLNSTPFIKEVGPVFIHSGTSSTNNAMGVLNEENARLSKSIKLSITDCDPYYSRISVAVVHYFGYKGVMSRENYLIDKSYAIKSGSSVVIFSGMNEVRSLLVEDIVYDNLQYNVSESHVQVDERYYGANWKGNDIDYSKLKEVARRMMPRAVVHPDNNFDVVTDENTTEFEYKEEEIYPLGVSFLIDGRYKTPVFPICGWAEGKKTDYAQVAVPDEPTVVLSNNPNIYANSINVGVVVESADGVPVTDKGICWAKTVNPTKLDDFISVGAGATPFYQLCGPLERDTQYFFRAYITTATDTYYSNELDFTTLEDKLVTLDAIFTESPDGDIATLQGRLLVDHLTVTEMGFEYGIEGDVLLVESVVPVAELMSLALTGLTPNATYVFRAYMISGGTTSYGEYKSFVPEINIPIVNTISAVSNAPDDGFTYSAEVTNYGVGITEKGVYYRDDGLGDPIPGDISTTKLVASESGYIWTTQVNAVVDQALCKILPFAANLNGEGIGTVINLLAP